MFPVAMSLCSVLALSNCEVQAPTALPNTAGASSDSSLNGSDVTPHYVSDDVRFPPPRIGTIRRKSGAKGHGRGGYLRMRSKYRNGHLRGDQTDVEYSNEYWIKRAILNKYDRNTLPARTDATTIQLYVGMSLYHILDTVISHLHLLVSE